MSSGAFHVLFVLVFFAGVITPLALTEGCSVEELDKCLVDLRGTHDRLGKQVIPNFTDSQLTDLCRHLKEAQPCMIRVEEICAMNNTDPVDVLKVSQRIEEINNGHDYICREDINKEYRNVVRKCAEDNPTELAATEEKCHNIYHNITWFLNKQNPDNVHIFCKAAKKYLSCIMEGVTPLCGKQVAEWTKRFHESLWEAHLKHISCDPEGGMETGAIAIVTMCAATLVYCIVCVIGAFLQEGNVCKKMSKKHKKDGKGEYMVQTQTSSDL